MVEPEALGELGHADGLARLDDVPEDGVAGRVAERPGLLLQRAHRRPVSPTRCGRAAVVHPASISSCFAGRTPTNEGPDAGGRHRGPDHRRQRCARLRPWSSSRSARSPTPTPRRGRGAPTPDGGWPTLLDDGSLVEYGPLAGRTSAVDDDGPADGLVGGVGELDGHPVVAASYDRSVADGTQSDRNQRKLGKLIHLAHTNRWPLVVRRRRRRRPPRRPPAAAADRRLHPGPLRRLRRPGRAVGLGADGRHRHRAGARRARRARLPVRPGDRRAAAPRSAAAPATAATERAVSERTVEELAARGEVDLLVDDEDAALDAARRYLRFWFDDPPADPAAVAPGARPRRPSGRSCPTTGAGPTTCAPDRRVRRRRQRAGAGPVLVAVDDHRPGPPRRPQRRHLRQPAALRQRRGHRQPAPPTRPPASSSCATPTSCRSCPSSTTPATWSAPTPSGAASPATTPARCRPSTTAPCRCTRCRSARPTGSAPRRCPATARPATCPSCAWPGRRWSRAGCRSRAPPTWSSARRSRPRPPRSRPGPSATATPSRCGTWPPACGRGAPTPSTTWCCPRRPGRASSPCWHRVPRTLPPAKKHPIDPR